MKYVGNRWALQIHRGSLDVLTIKLPIRHHDRIEQNRALLSAEAGKSPLVSPDTIQTLRYINTANLITSQQLYNN